MRIYNYVYPNYTYYQNKKDFSVNSNINFTSIKTISNTYGKFSVATQENLKNLHSNMNFIHDFFLSFRNPHKSIEIKNGYTDLVQKNRNSGISFNLPDNKGVLTVRRLLKNSDLMRFIVEKDGSTVHFLTDGYTKSVANVNQKNPQLLPKTFKYMLPNEILESNIEKYIIYADEKIQKYRMYLDQFIDDANIQTDVALAKVRERNAEKMRQYRASKKQNAMVVQKNEIPKPEIASIMKLFQLNPDVIPQHLKPILSPSKSILGFSLQTSDGATLKVSKKLNAKYGGSMAYLSFEKIFPDGERTFMSIDLNTYKFLKMKDAGKPLIRNHMVYEYSQEEIEKRNMVEKFDAFVSEIFKKEKASEVKPLQDVILPEVKPVQNQEAHEVVKPVEEKMDEVPKIRVKKSGRKQKAETPKNETELNKDILDNNFEKLKQNTVAKAIEDAKTLSDLYFKTFVEEFNKNISQKINDFRSNIDNFIQNLWQK